MPGWQAEQAKYDAAIAEIDAEEAALPAAPDPERYRRAAEVFTSVADIITDDRTDDGLRPILEAVGTVIVGERGVSVRYEGPAAWLVPEPRVIPWG